MGDGVIQALSVATLVIIGTLLFGAWDVAWNTVAYVTGDPSWRSSSVKEDDVLHGFSMRHNFAIRSQGPGTVRAKFEATNASDTPIGYIRIACTFQIVDEQGNYEDVRVKYEFGDAGQTIIPAHSTSILKAASDEYVRSYYDTGVPTVENVACTASPEQFH